MLFGVYISACSTGIDDRNSGTSSPKPAGNTVLNSEGNLPNTPVPPIESSSPNRRDIVLFDGKNYIKKSGWKTPSRSNAYIDESYDQGEVERLTVSGKQVKTKTLLYDYKTPCLYSQDFHYDGRDLDYLKGKLESLSFLEMSVNGKVFMYSISVEKVVTPPPSNNGPHVEHFGYQIQDRDGDGIFETLVGHDGDIIVPNWVLK